MANIVKTYTFVNGQPADATQVNKNFDDIISGVGDISAAGHALIDDASAAAQIVTLGTAAYSEGTWTPVLHLFTVVGDAPAVSGIYRRIGNLVFILCTIAVGDGGNTSVASSGGTSSISGLPYNPVTLTPNNWLNTYLENLGVGYAYGNSLLAPTFSATTHPLMVSAIYAD